MINLRCFRCVCVCKNGYSTPKIGSSKMGKMMIKHRWDGVPHFQTKPGFSSWRFRDRYERTPGYPKFFLPQTSNKIGEIV